MIEQTPRQRANTLEALNVMWPSVPPENVAERLAFYRDRQALGRRDSPPDCGTVACFGGWCAWWPTFRAQGVFAGDTGSPQTKQSIRTDRGAFVVSEFLFGYSEMFTAAGFHPADPKRNWKGVMPRGVSDHEIVTRRLKWVLENSRVVRS